jgi:hypothetical protein
VASKTSAPFLRLLLGVSVLVLGRAVGMVMRGLPQVLMFSMNAWDRVQPHLQICNMKILVGGLGSYL